MLCMWLTMFPWRRCEHRPKQLATSWDCSSSITWEYCCKDGNTTGKWPSLLLRNIFLSLSWISAGFSYSLHCRNHKICYLVSYNALQWRDENTKLIYIWLLLKPVGTIPGASSGPVDFLLTARSPSFFCRRFSRSCMLNIVVVLILKHSHNCKPS